jgi:hypothetical protein
MIESASEFIRLLESETAEDRRKASHDGAPEEVWMELAREYPETRAGIALNKTVPLTVLKELASDQDARIRSLVAMKRRASADILQLLSTDSSDAVRMKVARHKNTPRTTLLAMRDDSWDEIRSVVTARLEKHDPL